MAWENATVREIATGSTTNDTYYTNTSSNNYYRSGDEGPFSDVTFELSFLPKDYMSYEPGDYYLVGNAQYGIFLRKTGAAGANDGSVALKASYLGEADNNGSSPSVIGSWSVKSPYSDIWRQVSILCGVNEETQKGTIISYARWSGWCGRNDDYAIIHDAYNRYNNSTIGYNVIKKIKTLSGDVSGGAGSGYIGNSLLSNKKMVGYNVPTSDVESTKTESVNEASESPVSGKPKIGNGFARIKFLREVAQFRSIGLPLANRIVPAKFKPEYSYYYGEQEVPKGEQYYDIEGATPITIQRGGGDSFTFGDLPACFGIYDPNSSNVVNWYLRKVTSSGATMLVDGSNTGSFSPDGNYTFYVIAGGEPENPSGKGYFTVIRTTDWSNGWGGLAFSTDVMVQLRNYFTWG